MGIGKRLVILGFIVCVAAALLLLAAMAPALSNFAISGTPVCIPWMSIRCYKSDCGNYFQRCGSNALHAVPPQKVCYNSALLSIEKKHLHSCSSNNSSQNQHQRSKVGGCRGACGAHCCGCLCSSGVYKPVTCGGKSYMNQSVATCCTGIAKCGSSVPSLRQRLLDLIESSSVHVGDLFGGQWLMDNLSATFTFQAPLRSDPSGCCPGSGRCLNPCG